MAFRSCTAPANSVQCKRVAKWMSQSGLQNLQSQSSTHQHTPGGTQGAVAHRQSTGAVGHDLLHAHSTHNTTTVKQSHSIDTCSKLLFLRHHAPLVAFLYIWPRYSSAVTDHTLPLAAAQASEGPFLLDGISTGGGAVSCTSWIASSVKAPAQPHRIISLIANVCQTPS